MSVTLEESARLAGSHIWTERRLFEILGGWVATTAVPAAKLMLDRHSSHHAWRAGQWWDRLPVLADVDRDALVSPPGAVLEEALERLAALEGTAARLAGAYRFALPRLWSAYERHRSAAGVTADSSSLRTLGLLIPDLASDWHEGETLLQRLLADRDAVGAAAAAVAALEGALVG